MRNLHQISRGLSDVDQALIWWESREGYFGELVRFKDLLFRHSEYAKRYLPITELTPTDKEYVLNKWRAVGSPIVFIKEVFNIDVA